MRGAVTYARVVLSLSEAELAEMRGDEAFDEIILWLWRWRSNRTVNAAYQRLAGRLH